MADENKLKLHDLVPDQQVADRHSLIKATATASQDGNPPHPPVEVVFELPKGAGALFKENDKDTTTSKTGAMTGDVDPVYFYSTKPIAGGTLTAYWQNDRDNTLQTKTFTFTAAHRYELSFTTPPPSNNQPAEGGVDEGQVVVTDDGKQLSDPGFVIVKFEFEEGAAKFVLTDDPNIQPDSDETTLYVKTHFDADLKKDVANASFTDRTAEGVTVKASLADHPDVSGTQDFSFKAVNQKHTINLIPTIDNAVADGSTQNRILASVLDLFSNLDESYCGTVIFTLPDKSSASFVDSPNPKSKEFSAIGGLADAFFVSNKQDGENVTVTATLKDGSAPSASQDFVFQSSSYSYKFSAMLTSLNQNVQADGISPMGVGTMLGVHYDNPTRDKHLLRVSLPVASSAFFTVQLPVPTVKWINKKCCDVTTTIEDQEIVLVADNNHDGEKVEITAALKDVACSSGTVALTFTPVDQQS